MELAFEKRETAAAEAGHAELGIAGRVHQQSSTKTVRHIVDALKVPLK